MMRKPFATASSVVALSLPGPVVRKISEIPRLENIAACGAKRDKALPRPATGFRRMQALSITPRVKKTTPGLSGRCREEKTYLPRLQHPDVHEIQIGEFAKVRSLPLPVT